MSAERRGKYLWLVVAANDDATGSLESIVVHLGMSGQMLVQPADAPDEKHLRIRARLGSGTDLRFVDQRTFGGWAVADLVELDGSGSRFPWRTSPATHSTPSSTRSPW